MLKPVESALLAALTEGNCVEFPSKLGIGGGLNALDAPAVDKLPELLTKLGRGLVFRIVPLLLVKPPVVPLFPSAPVAPEPPKFPRLKLGKGGSLSEVFEPEPPSESAELWLIVGKVGKSRMKFDPELELNGDPPTPPPPVEGDRTPLIRSTIIFINATRSSEVILSSVSGVFFFDPSDIDPLAFASELVDEFAKFCGFVESVMFIKLSLVLFSLSL